MKKFVVYQRLSKEKMLGNQHGFKAQEASIKVYLDSIGKEGVDYEIIHHASEIKSGYKKTWKDSKILFECVDICEKNDAILLVSKVDRLRRSVEDVSHLIKRNFGVVFTENPQISKMEIQLKAVFAENEAEEISKRIKAALKAAKENAEKNGDKFLVGRSSPKYKVKNKYIPKEALENKDVIIKLLNGGYSTELIVDKLNELGVKSTRGLPLNKLTVLRYVKSLTGLDIKEYRRSKGINIIFRNKRGSKCK